MPGQDNTSTLERARRYSVIKYTLSITETVYIFILIFLFQGFGVSAAFVRSLAVIIKPDFLIFPAYLLFVFLLYYVLAFPLNFYGSFIVEHKFRLSNQKFHNWFFDQVKAGIVSYIISIIIFGAFYYILKHNPATWWVTVSLCWIFFSLILAKLAPVLIIPLFFKYKPLSDDVLRQRIKVLADKMKVKILDVFEIDFSKKTLKANAAFAGWGNTRRVLLADTLKDKYTHDEIEVILTHEFAHYQMKHLLKLMLINSFTTLGVFYLMFKTSYSVLRGFGLFSLEDVAAFPVIILYFMVFGLVMQPLGNYISRRFERNADMAALRITGLKEAFISMMDKLSDQNLSDRKPHPIIKFFFFDHPPVDERIAMARAYNP
jgi:STE24 endopeptidase